MARFKYLGETPRVGVIMGPLKEIRIPKKDGTKLVLTPLVGDHFPVGQDIGYDITDERSLRVLTADTRYEKISA